MQDALKSLMVGIEKNPQSSYTWFHQVLLPLLLHRLLIQEKCRLLIGLLCFR
jgi:hypothetical protein